MRVAILTSHPVQYQAPWFRALAPELDLTVYFAHRQSASEQGEAGFGVAFDWDVDLLSGYRSQFLENVSRRPSVLRYSGCDTPAIRGLIAGGNFDAVIVSGWYLKSYWQAIRACRKAGVPVLVRGDSQLQTPRSSLKRVAKSVTHALLLKQFDGFLYVGKRNAEYLKHYGADERRMFFVPHFVDNAWFAAQARAATGRRPEMRERWGAQDRTLVALFVGKLIPEKRPNDFVRAIGAARLGGIDVKGVFVGSGELESRAKALAAELEVPVSFEGFRNQSELPSFYAAADVLVLPSQSETWGLVVNEAMACGLPAIVSDAVGCAPDLIEEGLTGFTYPCGEAPSLANRLAETFTLVDRRHSFQAALDGKLACYNVERAIKGTLEAVHSSAAKPSSRHDDGEKEN